MFYSRHAGGLPEHFGTSSDITTALLDAENIAYGVSLTLENNLANPTLDATYVMLLMGGQSLASGQAGMPRLSKTARPGCFMIGDSVQPARAYEGYWTPVGNHHRLNPLVATVIGPINSGVDAKGIDDRKISAGPIDYGLLGENPIVATANFLSAAYRSQRRQIKNIVAMSAACPGRPIEELIPGGRGNRYGRHTGAVAKFIEVVPVNESREMVAFVLIQGESNYTGMYGGTQDRDHYKQLAEVLMRAIRIDCAAMTGQTVPPIVLVCQSGGISTRDNHELGIGMAQWELCRENTWAYMFGPSYPYPGEDGPHLTSNGYRWMGQKAGQVLYKLLVLREEWEPLSPLWIGTVNRTIFIGYHVPEPPIVFDASYYAGPDGGPVMYADKGFMVTDALGAITIDHVRTVGATIIAIDCSRPPDRDTAKVWYGDRATHKGHGNVRDSDASIADDVYEFTPMDGMRPNEYITELIGKPYPMWNWSIQFCLPIAWQAIG